MTRESLSVAGQCSSKLRVSLRHESGLSFVNIDAPVASIGVTDKAVQTRIFQLNVGLAILHWSQLFACLG